MKKVQLDLPKRFKTSGWYVSVKDRLIGYLHKDGSIHDGASNGGYWATEEGANKAREEYLKGDDMLDRFKKATKAQRKNDIEIFQLAPKEIQEKLLKDAEKRAESSEKALEIAKLLSKFEATIIKV